MDTEALFKRAWDSINSETNRGDAKFWFTVGLMLRETQLNPMNIRKANKSHPITHVSKSCAIKQIITEFNAWRMDNYCREKVIPLEDLDAFLLKILNKHDYE